MFFLVQTSCRKLLMDELDREILVIIELLAMNRAQRREHGCRWSKEWLEHRLAQLEAARLVKEKRLALPAGVEL